MSLLRWIETVRRLAPAQVAWRVYYALERRLGPHPPLLSAPHTCLLPAGLFSIHHRATDADMQWVQRLRVSEVCFLHQARRFRGASGEWDWQFGDAVPAPSRLWQFQLHSFGWAAPLARAGEYALLEEQILSWVSAHPVAARAANRVAWNSYTLSNRIEQWAYAEAISGRRFAAAVHASARQQAAYLASHLEYDLRGNHLVRNACALLVAAAWLQAPEAKHWRERAVQTVAGCARRQILADGGHYERSPMYHLLVMEDLDQCLGLLRHADQAPGCQTLLADKLCRMYRFASALQCGDGDIPLLNDAVRGVAPVPGKLLARIGANLLPDGQTYTDGLPLPHLCPDSGLAILRCGLWHAIVDGGVLGPNEQPGHAHCDLGSVVASYGSERVLEDTGVFEYQAGERRRYARSTAAHNTLQVSDREQGDCWGEFRLGRRARPISLAAPSPQFCRLEYAWPGVPVRHRRAVTLSEFGLVIEDDIRGSGTRNLTLRWHFAPGLVPVREADFSLWASARGLRFHVALPIGWAWTLERTPFFPEFGREQGRCSLVGRIRTRLPVHARVDFEVFATQ